MAAVVLRPGHAAGLRRLLQRVNGVAAGQEQCDLARTAGRWAQQVRGGLSRGEADAVAELLRVATGLELSGELRWRVEFWAAFLGRRR